MIDPEASGPVSPARSWSWRADAKALARASGVYGLGLAAGRVLSLVTLPVFTRFLTPEEYGILALLAILALALRSFFGLGVGPAIGVVYFRKDEAGHRAATVWTALALMVASLAVLNVAAVVARGPVASLVLGDSGLGHLVMLQVGLLSAQLVLEIIRLRLQFERQAALFGVLTVGTAATSVGLSFALVAGAGLGVEGWLLGHVVASAGSVVVHLLVLLRSASPAVDRRTLGELLRISIPLIPTGFVVFVLLNTGPYFVEAVRSVADAGLYNVGFQLGMGISLVTSAFGTAWYPYFQSHMRAPEAASAKFPRLATVYVGAFGALVLVFFAASEVATIVLTDAAFRDAAAVIGPVALSQYLLGFWSMVRPGMFFTDDVRLLPVLQGGAAIVTVAAYLVLLELLGLEGGGWARAAGVASLVALQLGLNRWRQYDVRMVDGAQLARLAVALVLAIGAIRALQHYLAVAPAALLSAGVIAAYLAAGWWLVSPAMRVSEADHLPAGSA